MSDVMPKVKYYIIVSIVLFFINLGIFISSCAVNNTFDLLAFGIIAGTTFIPIVSGIATIVSVIASLPAEILIFLGIFTGILTGLQTFIIAMIILQTVSNLFWSPDV